MALVGLPMYVYFKRKEWICERASPSPGERSPWPPRSATATGAIGWLRAAVLGADDGIVSIAEPHDRRGGRRTRRTVEVIVAGFAGLVAGAMSMAAGEYVSVSAQRDTERADIAREQRELHDEPGARARRAHPHLPRRGARPRARAPGRGPAHRSRSARRAPPRRARHDRAPAAPARWQAAARLGRELRARRGDPAARARGRRSGRRADPGASPSVALVVLAVDRRARRSHRRCPADAAAAARVLVGGALGDGARGARRRLIVGSGGLTAPARSGVGCGRVLGRSDARSPASVTRAAAIVDRDHGEHAPITISRRCRARVSGSSSA